MESVTKECADGLSNLDMLEVGAISLLIEQTSSILCRSGDIDATTAIGIGDQNWYMTLCDQLYLHVIF